jgi:hypothetical protein
MALELTDRARLEAERTSIEPQLVLEIEGVDTVFGAVEILKYIRIGDPGLYIGNDWVIGGLNAVENQEEFISLQGTGTSIQQQLRPDQGSVSSVSSILVQLIDKNQILTEIISPGVIVEEILGRRAKLWLGFRKTAWKEDYVKVFGGIIDDVIAGAGFVQLNISHPDQKKRQTLFVKKKTTLSTSLNNSALSVPITNASTIFDTPVTGPSGSIDTSIRYYVRINDEIIRYTGATSTHLTGCTRAQLGTSAASHSANDQAESFYVLEGALTDLALKLMLSGVNDYYRDAIAVENFNVVDPFLNVPNSIFFEGVNIEEEYGLVAGDYFTTTGAANGANNVTLKQITAIEVTNDGSYLIASSVAFVDETDSAAVIKFRSQYDTLGIGCAMTPEDVDVEEHHYWRDLILSTYEYRFYVKEEINAKDFIEKQIYAPYGAYSIPRKAKASMGYHIGPIPRDELPVFDKDNIRKPQEIKLRRTIAKNFANTIIYGYDQDALEDKFLSGLVYRDETSRNRIDVGVKPMTFQAEGIRTDLEGAANTALASERLLGRYRFAAEFFEGLKAFFKGAFNVEPGDLALMDFEDLGVANTRDGNREKPAKFFQVYNKSTDLKTGDIKLELVDTAFESNERYGIISPSSVIAVSGSTTYAYIQDTPTEGPLYPGDEPRKWENYIGLPVLVHDENFTFQEEVVFTGFDAGDRYKMLFDTPLSTPVVAGWIIDIPTYSASLLPKINRRYKLFHPHLSPLVPITAGTSQTVFTIGAGDVGKVQEGFPARVHNENFTDFSPEVTIASIVGTTVTVSAALGFTPTSSHFLQLLGFPDGDPCYRWI